MNTMQMLREALAVLKRDGWIQNDYHRGGAHCAVGALETVRSENGIGFDTFMSAQRLLDDAATEMTNGSRTSIIELNDAEKTTFERVRDAFQLAIRKAKEA